MSTINGLCNIGIERSGTSSYGSKILNQNSAKITLSEVTAQFVYAKFDPLEQIDENTGDTSNRYVRIDWKTGDGQNLIDLDISRQLTQNQQFFLMTDFQAGYCYYTTSTGENLSEISNKMNDQANDQDKFQYLLTLMANGETTVELGDDLLPTSVPVYDESSGMPIIESERADLEQPPDFVLLAHQAEKIIRGNVKSAFTQDRLYDQIAAAKNIQSRSESKKSDRGGWSVYNLLNNLPQLSILFTEDRKTAGENPDGSWGLLEWKPVGYIIIKSRMENENAIFMYSRWVDKQMLVGDGLNPSYIDPHVSYGQTYRYEIRPILGKTKEIPSDMVADTGTLILVAGDESYFVDVECQEKRVPNPPQGLRFEYIGDNQIEITWIQPPNFTELDDISGQSTYNSETGKWESAKVNIDVEDTAGWQIFYRNSLYDPYILEKYFIFNNTHPYNLRVYSPENIPDSKIENYEIFVEPGENGYGDIPLPSKPESYIMAIQNNTDYYFAMSSVDAHGNSSNLSVQYKVNRNNVTGEVSVQVISGAGAPKMYPNLLVPGKLVQPSFTVSGFKNMDIYYCPDTKKTQMEDTSSSSGLNIQLFELETQIQKNIQIKQKPS